MTPGAVTCRVRLPVSIWCSSCMTMSAQSCARLRRAPARACDTRPACLNRPTSAQRWMTTCASLQAGHRAQLNACYKHVLSGTWPLNQHPGSLSSPHYEWEQTTACWHVGLIRAT